MVFHEVYLEVPLVVPNKLSTDMRTGEGSKFDLIACGSEA